MWKIFYFVMTLRYLQVKHCLFSGDNLYIHVIFLLYPEDIILYRYIYMYAKYWQKTDKNMSIKQCLWYVVTFDFFGIVSEAVTKTIQFTYFLR